MSNNGLNLGLRSERLLVHLTDGGDFQCVLELDEDWPVGTSLNLEVGAATWAATISGAEASFVVDKADADLVPDGTTARLVYSNGTTDQVWATGTVVRNG